MRSQRAFTDTFLRHLRPKPERYDVTDPGRRGLQVRVYPSGQRSFQMRYQYNGSVRRLTFGPYPLVTLAEVHFAHAEAEKLLLQGKDPASVQLSARQAERTAGTVADLAEEFMQRYVLQHRKRPDQVQQMLDRNVLPYWKNRKAKDIRPRDVTLLLDRVVDRGALVTANRVSSVVSQMFKFGVQRGLLDGSPCVALQRPGGIEEARDRKLNEDEIRALWKKLADADMSATTKIAIRLLLVTAQRRGELANARWSDINFEDHIWTIPADHAKNGKEHTVPLSAMAVELLKDLQTRTSFSDWLFPSPRESRGPVVDRSLSRAVRNNEAHFGIPHFTPHDLRRTAASMMTMLGIPRLHVSKVLNHAEDSITAVYDRHDYLGEKRTALETWANHLADVINGKVAKVVPLRFASGVERLRA
jgi:integrase